MLLWTVRSVPGSGGVEAVLIYLICTLASAQGDTLNEVLSWQEVFFFSLNKYLKLTIIKKKTSYFLVLMMSIY